MNTFDIPVRPGQVWGDKEDIRDLIIKHVTSQHVHCLDDNGRRTRILRRRMHPPNYYLKKESPARYVDVPSETGECTCGEGHYAAQHLTDGCRRCRKGRCQTFDPKITYHVWTGDEFSPAHCPCENFRHATRIPGEAYYCKHLKLVLFNKGMV